MEDDTKIKSGLEIKKPEEYNCELYVENNAEWLEHLENVKNGTANLWDFKIKFTTTNT